MMLRLVNPWGGAFLLCLLALLVYWIARRRRRATLVYSGIEPLRRLPAAMAVRLRHLPAVLRVSGLALLVVAFARPQTGRHEEEILTEGIDIVVALDDSGSMRAEDFKPNNRLDVAKDELLKQVDIAPRDEDGTAIGMGLATAVARLKDAKGRSKVIVLLTDGANNRGQIDPMSGARLAQAFGIKVHTIGVGTEGEVPYPIDDPIMGKRYITVKAEIDEKSLQEIASVTGGQYFRATDTRSLRMIFATIDKMEKSEIKVRGYTRHTERFADFLYPGALLILGEFALGGTVLRRIP